MRSRILAATILWHDVIPNTPFTISDLPPLKLSSPRWIAYLMQLSHYGMIEVVGRAPSPTYSNIYKKIFPKNILVQKFLTKNYRDWYKQFEEELNG